MNARWLKWAAAIELLLFLALVYAFNQAWVKISDLESEVAELKTSRSIAWFKELVFEGRVRGLTNSTLVFFGHSEPTRGYYFTIEQLDEYMGIGPYKANTYVNVSAESPLDIFLRDAKGDVVGSVTLENLRAGDLVIAWFTDEEVPVSELTSPDEWRLPALHGQDGLVVAIDHFAGETR